MASYTNTRTDIEIHIDWEVLADDMLHGQLHRTKVPGGWLVRSWTRGSAGLTYVPDPNYKWK